MQENDFEKQVGKLMEDVTVTPSAPVWEYVEKRIPKSSRKRRFAALFLLLIGFAVSGYFFYDKYQNTDDGNADNVPAITKHADKITPQTIAKKNPAASLTWLLRENL